MSPFDIEEIFPDVAAGSVRLPRRQIGGSPQGVAVTLLADYSLRTRAWLPSAAIVALLEEFNVTPGSARTAISRLARRGVLENTRHGRNSAYRLTRPAAANLSVGGSAIVAYAGAAESWDGWWTLIAFSVPQERSVQRRALRGQLRWQGYAPLYDALWISPHPSCEPALAQLSGLAPGTMSVFRAQHVELGAITPRSPLDAWDTPAIARQYEDFVRRWDPLLPRIRTGEVSGAEAVRARTEVMDTYRRFPILDPQLPARLMPTGWPRGRAREVFVNVYDGLARPAEGHVLDVVARFADGPRPDVRAHTVADLLGGLSGGPGLADAGP